MKKSSALCALVLGILAAACIGMSACSSQSEKIVVGTLATEDILPYWVAEDEGLFEAAGLDVEIMVFQSATELIAGITSGAVDYAMTDPMVAAGIHVSGTSLCIEWVTLGTTAAQGRFGILVGPDSTAQTLSDLAGKGIGVGSNTVPEYVMDTLMTAAGVAEPDIIAIELQKVPVRYQMVLSGEVEAAALPGSLLALGEANGCRVIADDTTGDNVSLSVMVARTSVVDAEGGAATLEKMKSVWNQAVGKINATPEAYRALLVEKANLNESIADTYPISEYPTCQLPEESMVTNILDWMVKKGYLEADILTYNAATGEFVLS